MPNPSTVTSEDPENNSEETNQQLLERRVRTRGSQMPLGILWEAPRAFHEKNKIPGA